MNMTKGSIALICGCLAIILSSLAWLIGAGGLGFLVLELLTFVLVLPAEILGIRASKNKGAPGYRAGMIGQWIGSIACLELVAALLVSYL
jgi:hypothetical protein